MRPARLSAHTQERQSPGKQPDVLAGRRTGRSNDQCHRHFYPCCPSEGEQLMSISLRRSVAAVTVAGLAGTTAVLGAAPAQSVPDPVDRQCPEPYPVSDLVKGAPVDGLTVSSGT